jgi:hypothetical protein
MSLSAIGMGMAQSTVRVDQTESLAPPARSEDKLRIHDRLTNLAIRNKERTLVDTSPQHQLANSCCVDCP